MSVSLDGVSFLQETEQPEFVMPGDKTNLGKDAFLKLLVAQMQNQDPLNPQSNEEFIAQLSQFTQVEQLLNLNDNFDSLYMAMNSVNNTSMTQLLGKDVVAVGDQFSYSGEGSVELHYDASSVASNSKVIVYDEDGSIVYSGAGGSLQQGQNHIVWDGKDVNGKDAPPGVYRFSIEGQGQDGESVNVIELMVGTIDGMSFVEGVPKPSIDEIEFDLSMILKVESNED
ncbi:MAG: flagellar hook capping FlgD N-terminal domain-containing protein [Myxococcota bacterium]|nr:flagellar hook capping FlgD N-terminal domain-containing protein [Myxococcota bacterium]